MDAIKHTSAQKPVSRIGAHRDGCAQRINFRETALGDARAEATLISGEIVPFNADGRAIDLCERGIPRKYWSARPVAEKVRKWEELGSSRVEEGMLVGCVMGVGECVGVQCVFG